MSAAFTHLSAPSLEDTMEVSSSPAGNVFDNDIDIDFEDYSGGIHFTDDERMLEDGDPSRPPTANDEMMDDDDNTVVEEVMQDDQPLEQVPQPDPADEELIDYDDDNYQDVNQSFFDDTTLQNTEISFPAPTEVVAEPEVVFEESSKLQNHAPPTDEIIANDAHEDAHEYVEIQPTIGVADETEAKDDQANELVEEAEDEQQAEVAGDIPYEEADGPSEAQDATAPQAEEVDDGANIRKAPPQFPGTLDTTLTGEVPDGPPTPTDTGLLPMIVTYRDYSLPLFKSKKQPEGLLKNDNLASTGLSDLMQDCRRRLQAKLGETEAIPENHHIVLGFDRLALVLVECDTSAYDICLNDIIQVWEQLHFNDDLDVPPLSITLTSQPKFSSALGLLQEAVNQEHGITGLQGAAAFSDRVEHVAEEPAGHNVDAEDAQFDNESADAVGNEGRYDEHGGEYAEEYADEYEGYQEDVNEQRQHGQDTTGEQNAQLEANSQIEDGQHDDINYAEFDENEEYPDPEEPDDEQYLESNHTHAHAPDNQDQTGFEPQAEIDQKPADNSESASAASSMTARGDAANDTAEANPEQAYEGSSTFLEEYEGDGAEAEPDDAEHPIEEDGETHEEALVPTEHLEKEHAADHPDLQGSVAGSTDEQYQEDPDEGLIQYDDDTVNEADYVEHDDEAADELGEEEEQFHTALDALEGDEADVGEETAATGFEDNTELQAENPDEDDIGYEDDLPETETTADATTNSPLGKRSFEEHADEDELDFEEPELKKARSG